MVSRRRQPSSLAAPRTASSSGEIAVEEYGYGLGPPTGILVLRYPPGHTVPDFPEDRDDFLHQIFWSPDGVLVVRRGDTSRFVSSGEMLWIRRGVVAEVRGLGVQTVLRICVRRAPEVLTGLSAAVLSPEEHVGVRLSALARPGVHEEDALRARGAVLDALADCPAEEVDHAGCRVAAAPAHVVARALLGDPADPTSLADWAARLHVSPKTLQRDFEREFATTFTGWRTRTRLRASIAMLHDLSVTETAHRVGYASASAFVAAFTREFGETPGRFAGVRAAS